MEYTVLEQPITLIFVSFSFGVFFGGIWVFVSMCKYNKELEKELDSKTKTLDSYENKYVNDDYEAY